jgi:hypothetical protein
MASICIYTRPDVLLHKQGKLENDDDYSESGDYFWELPSEPKEEVEKIYFATKGFIRGYFDVYEQLGTEVHFNCSTWQDINPIPQKPFQGFKYLKGD